MDADAYRAWSGRYAATFGLTSDSDAGMLVAWREVFDACGYSVAELEAARLHIASKGPPKFRTEHLAAIHAAITDRRGHDIANQRRASVDDDGYGACDTCGGTGWVIVPHARAIRDGQWVRLGISGYPTMAVTCGCWKGRRCVETWDAMPPDKQKKYPRPMTLEYYETRICPHGRRLIAEHDKALAADGRAHGNAALWDKKYGPLLAKFKLPAR